MGEDEERTVFTVAEAARELGISENTVKGAIKRGVIQVQRMSPRLNLIAAAEIEKYRRERLGKRGGYRGRRSKPAAEDPTSADTPPALREGDA